MARHLYAALREAVALGRAGAWATPEGRDYWARRCTVRRADRADLPTPDETGGWPWCGTRGGAARHRWRGERPCPACRRAEADRVAAYRARRRGQG